MAQLSDYLVPAILVLAALVGSLRRQDVYGCFLSGASKGLSLLKSIFPSLLALLTAVSLFRASGAVTFLETLLSPLLGRFGIPPECTVLMLIRPFSGSGALAVGAELIARYGVNSTIGRTAAVMLGSTETTFYTISIYFGAAGIQKTRYTIPAALIADLTAFWAAAFFVRFFY